MAREFGQVRLGRSGGINLTGKGLTKLRKLHKKLESIAQVKTEIARAQSKMALLLVDSGFKREQNPYGRKWRKRKRETDKTRGKRILQGQTNRLRQGWRVVAIGQRGFRIQASVDYAIVHQKGRGRIMAKRTMVPSTGKFPRKWRRPMNVAAVSAVLRHFKRSGLK